MNVGKGGMVADALAAAMTPPPRVTMREWCERNLVIGDRQPSPSRGPYRTALTPWVRGWFEALQDPAIHTVVIRKGAQVAATQTAYSAICHWIVNDPGPTLIVMPAEDDAKSNSETRLMPLIEDSPACEAERTSSPDDWKKLHYILRRCNVRWVGANSPGKLASRPIRYLVLDEVDKYPIQSGDEGSSMALALQRTKRFWSRKIIVISTPTVAGSNITRYFDKGDQRRFYVPCPRCGEFQTLKWAQVKFNADAEPDEVAASARYQCESCNGDILDRDKPAMLERGEWRATTTAKVKGIASFDLSGLYPALPGSGFGDLAQKFLSVKDSAPDLQDFINSDLGEIWEERPKAQIDRRSVWEIRDRHKYPRGTCPHDGMIWLWLLVDVQQGWLPWAVYGIAERDIYLVDHGQAGDFTDLDLKLAQEYSVGGQFRTAQAAMIDTGYNTPAVYEWCRLPHACKVFPLKGGGDIPRTVATSRVVWRVDLPNEKLALWHIHATEFHRQAAELLSPITLDAGERIEDRLRTAPVRLHFHEEIDRDFVDEITAEVLIEPEPNKRGIALPYWKKIRRDNHQWDLLRYALAARYLMRDDLARAGAEAKDREQNQDKPNVKGRRITYD